MEHFILEALLSSLFVSFLTRLNAHACCTTAPSSGISNEQIINVNVLLRKINWMLYFNKAY